MPRPRNKGNFNHFYFQHINTEAKAYWLGFIMADGYIKDTAKSGALQLIIHLNKKDFNHLVKFHESLESKSLVGLNKDNSIRSSHSSDILCNSLIKLGCTPRKSLTLRFPKINKDVVNHFIRGYFDGDGSVCLHNKRLLIDFLGTKQFLTVLRKKILVKNKIQKINNIHKILIGKNENCYRIYNYFYKNASIFLERKKNVFDKWLSIRMNMVNNMFEGITYE